MGIKIEELEVNKVFENNMLKRIEIPINNNFHIELYPNDTFSIQQHGSIFS